MLDLDAVDLLGPAPLVLIEALDPGKACLFDTTEEALFLALMDFAVGEAGEEVAMGPVFAGRLVGQGSVLVEEEGKFEEGEMIGEEGGFHGW